MKSLYDILGVPRDADTDQIRGVYRSKAQKMHPDKSDASDANEKFQELKMAYEVLSNPERRAQYDQTGSTAQEPTIDDQARQQLIGIWLGLVDKINDVQYNDMIAALNQVIDAHILGTNTQIQVLTRKIEKLRNVAKRVARLHSETPTFLIDSIEAVARDNERLIEVNKHALKVSARMREMMKDYRYEVDRHPLAGMQNGGNPFVSGINPFGGIL